MSVEELDGALADEETAEEGEARHTLGDSGSLGDRMRVRAAELEAERTRRFPLPGYADMLELELRTLGWERVRKITDRHVRRRDVGLRDLYTAADTLLNATVGFLAVGGGPLKSGWVELARNVNTELPEDTTPRRALFSLLRADSTTAVIDLWNEWNDWNNAERTTIGEELDEDFGTTR